MVLPMVTSPRTVNGLTRTPAPSAPPLSVCPARRWWNDRTEQRVGLGAPVARPGWVHRSPRPAAL